MRCTTSAVAAALVAIALVTATGGWAGTGTVWPQPKSIERGNATVAVAAQGFAFVLMGRASDSDILQQAIVRYRPLCFPQYPNEASTTARSRGAAATATTAISVLTIDVMDVSEQLELGTDESYTLVVSDMATAATLHAPTVFGALRGLETFSQLVRFNEDNGTYDVPFGPVTIKDAPRFPWRGLLVDTSRHYLSLDTLRRTIDALAYNKLNTFHWHIVDAEAFPLVSKKFPLLSQKGAYGNGHYIYTQEDVHALQQYAKYRGIRVLPEIDSPGHTKSWGFGYPELMANCPVQDAMSTFSAALNPVKNNTYEFLESLFFEMSPVFHDDFIHIGGDELNYKCWAADSSIREYIRNEGIDLKELFRRYWLRLLDIVKRSGKRTVAWEEVFTYGLNPPVDGVIQIWTNTAYLEDVVRGGYPSLLSAGWYLDRQSPLGDQGRNNYFWLDTWKDMYENEPVTSTMTPEEQALILGGEAAIWGEQIDDKTIDERVWPRASAVAERLWSPKEVRFAAEAEPRLRNVHCHLSTRGIASSPIFPGPPCVV